MTCSPPPTPPSPRQDRPRPPRLGGWSYGGILTDYTIATTTRFKAASSGAGTAKLFGMYGVDQYILQYDNELAALENPDVYIKLSYPFFHMDRIKTPTLFMGGDKDFNVTLVGGEQMYQALKSTGVEASLIVYPGQFHGFTRPSFIRDAASVGSTGMTSTWASRRHRRRSRPLRQSRPHRKGVRLLPAVLLQVFLHLERGHAA